MVSIQGSMIILTLLAGPSFGQAQFLNRSVTAGEATYRYKVFLPAGWKREEATPVILFLHGAGERGDDNEAQASVGLGPCIARQKDFPFIVVLPQCARGRWWPEADMQAQALKALE
ncbi:MAG: hypothetical protein AB1631_19945, partial [Acidobacteriota bacterium]